MVGAREGRNVLKRKKLDSLYLVDPKRGQDLRQRPYDKN